ncbi:hypothetical protein D3C73_1426420 [compost metagenome]
MGTRDVDDGHPLERAGVGVGHAGSEGGYQYTDYADRYGRIFVGGIDEIQRRIQHRRGVGPHQDGVCCA